MDPTTRETILLGLYFMILFTAFNSFQTIVTKINEDAGDYTLGPFRFALNYTVFMLSNLFAPQFKYSEKWLMTLAALTYVLQYSTGLLMEGTSTPVKFISASIGSIINGIGASFLWTNMGSYLHQVCHFYGKEKQKGYYFGLFNMIFCVSTILGALIVTFGLSLFSHTVYFIIVAGVALLAFFYAAFFIKDIRKIHHKEVKEKEEEEPKPKVRQSALRFSINAAKETLKYYPIMKYTLFLIFLEGSGLGVSTSTMLHLLPKVADKTQNSLHAGFCLLMYGCGCTLGGFLGGRLPDRFRIKPSAMVNMFFFCICCLFSILASQLMELWSAMVGCFLWGFVLYYQTGLLFVICSRLYEGKPETFALVKQFHAFSFVVYQVVSLSTGNSIPVLYIMIALLILAIPAIWGICNFPEEKSSEFQQDSQQKQVKNQQSNSSLQQDLLTHVE